MNPAIRIEAIETLPDDYLARGDFSFTIACYALPQFDSRWTAGQPARWHRFANAIPWRRSPTKTA